ncbi:hypothetical protein [Nocardia nepalensis]|uniref:hypothetical protein n=1 Tax=Nocardia nepalensis TaxID=3375448 RepID=UPI003B6800EF
MSARKKNKNTTTRPASDSTDPTTTTTASGDEPVTGVPALRTDTDKALWAALGNNPGFTADELAGAAGIAGSTTRRILSGWETTGTARSHRDPESPRAAKTWTTAEHATAAPSAGPTTTEPVAEPTEPATADAAEPVTVEPTEPETDSVSSQSDAIAQPESVPADPERDTGQPETAVAAAPAPDSPAPVPDAVAAQPESAERLAPGALRGQVEDFLRDHPGEEYTPHQIGKALDRSSGAVHNALVKLTTLGTASQTGEGPKTFALAEG